MFMPLKSAIIITDTLDSFQVLFYLFFIIYQVNRVFDCQVSVLPVHDSAVNIDHETSGK